MLWEPIRNKITRKIILFVLGGWKARGIPNGGFGRVLAIKEKKGKKFWSAGSPGLRAVIVVVAVPIRSRCVHDFENIISPNFGVRASHEVCRLCCWIHLIVLH